MELKYLPNIGPVLAANLQKIGIENAETLRTVGAEEAWLRIRLEVDTGACLHQLQALADNPALAAEGKDAFSLDSKEPTGDYQAFLDGEVRYNALKRANPERAAKLFDKNESEARARYAYLNKLKTLYGAE